MAANEWLLCYQGACLRNRAVLGGFLHPAVLLRLLLHTNL